MLIDNIKDYKGIYSMESFNSNATNIGKEAIVEKQNYRSNTYYKTLDAN